MFKNINDLLAFFLMILIIPGFWVAHGYHLINLPGEAIGASIAVWTLVAQYYFRKPPPAAK